MGLLKSIFGAAVGAIAPPEVSGKALMKHTANLVDMWIAGGEHGPVLARCNGYYRPRNPHECGSSHTVEVLA